MQGYNYLFKLEDKVILNTNERMISSPKSSLGRLFPNSRLLTDFNPCFNETYANYKSYHELEMWLLVQPTFNLIVYPEISLNQLRFFNGPDAKLSDMELEQEFKKYALLKTKNRDELVPIPLEELIIHNGLAIHPDLKGKNTNGIIGLKANKNNPNPIDLKKINEYNVEDFFIPIQSGKGEIVLEPGESYLLATNEVLDIPAHLSAEMDSKSDKSIRGLLHFAGFIDNGFRGNLVAEIQPSEQTGLTITDSTPISNIQFFWSTQTPDKQYGKDIGSNYQGQSLRAPKYFKGVDFAEMAKQYKKLSRKVLTVPTSSIEKQIRIPEGFELLSHSEEALETYQKIIENEGIPHHRYDCETDEKVLQIIPYTLIFGPNETVFSYIRYSGENKDFYGDIRLHGKHSIGAGGHIDVDRDGPEDYIGDCIKRELAEEIQFEKSYSQPKLIGTLKSTKLEVDRVHFGLIFAIQTEGNVKPNEEALVKSKMAPINELITNSNYPKEKQGIETETWSAYLIPWLNDIYKQITT